MSSRDRTAFDRFHVVDDKCPTIYNRRVSNDGFRGVNMVHYFLFIRRWGRWKRHASHKLLAHIYVFWVEKRSCVSGSTVSFCDSYSKMESESIIELVSEVGKGSLSLGPFPVDRSASFQCGIDSRDCRIPSE